MEAKLIVVGGDAKATEINLKLPTIIGRGRGATLTLPHPLVSRQHCEIYEAEGGLFVRDLGSLNGTFIGNEPITEAPLPPGELLTVGAVTFRAIYGELLEKEKHEKEQGASAPRRSRQSPTKTARDQSVETLAEPHLRTFRHEPATGETPLATPSDGPPSSKPPRQPPKQDETAWAPNAAPLASPQTPFASANAHPPANDGKGEVDALVEGLLVTEEARAVMPEDATDDDASAIDAEKLAGRLRDAALAAGHETPGASSASSPPPSPNGSSESATADDPKIQAMLRRPK
jgi:pSer/pThr/pTyr-binding forkhead associated (FHA) protein